MSLWSRLFRSRTVFYSGLWVGGMLGAAVWASDLGLSRGTHAVVAVLAGLAAMLAIAWLLRNRAPDVPMRRLSVEQQAALFAADPGQQAMLLIVIPRERFGFYRLDILLDDIHLGQLKPGTGFLLPIQPGDRRIEVFSGTRRNREMAYFSTQAGRRPGFRVHANISRVTYVHIEPWTVLGNWVPTEPHDIRLVEPLASGV